MASKEKKSGGDFVLESRHLVGLFLLLVVIFGVVFTLGYLLGRSQYDAKLRAAVGPPPGTEVQAAPAAPKAKAKPDAENSQLPKKNSDFDFYHSADQQAPANHLQPASKSLPASASPAGSAKPAAASSSVPAKTAKPSNPSSVGEDGLVPKGAIMLQVAAVLHQDDALALAQALQQKKFPAFVLTPGADKLYRVQVGPYTDNQSAANARQQLEAQGFKSIIKR
jgi:septal ring-binding cell division protein DamX